MKTVQRHTMNALCDNLSLQNLNTGKKGTIIFKLDFVSNFAQFVTCILQ